MSPFSPNTTPKWLRKVKIGPTQQIKHPVTQFTSSTRQHDYELGMYIGTNLNTTPNGPVMHMAVCTVSLKTVILYQEKLNFAPLYKLC